MRVAAAVTVESGAGEAVRNLRHESRVSGALRRIEAEPEEPVTKERLCADSCNLSAGVYSEAELAFCQN